MQITFLWREVGWEGVTAASPLCLMPGTSQEQGAAWGTEWSPWGGGTMSQNPVPAAHTCAAAEGNAIPASLWHHHQAKLP